MAETKPGICCMCKRPIRERERHFRCSVSSCNSGKLKLRFCTVACWEAHLPTARHRNADWVELAGEPAPSTLTDERVDPLR